MNTTQKKVTRKGQNRSGNTKYSSFVHVHKKYFTTEKEIHTQDKTEKPQDHQDDVDIFDRILSYQD